MFTAWDINILIKKIGTSRSPRPQPGAHEAIGFAMNNSEAGYDETWPVPRICGGGLTEDAPAQLLKARQVCVQDNAGIPAQDRMPWTLARIRDQISFCCPLLPKSHCWNFSGWEPWTHLQASTPHGTGALLEIPPNSFTPRLPQLCVKHPERAVNIYILTTC